jgi:hypothetical protein
VKKVCARWGVRVTKMPSDQSITIADAYDLTAPSDPILVRLLDYWQSKRGGRQMPSRADIDPVELRTLVHNVMLYDVDVPAGHFRVRLVGQAIVDFVGADYTGRLVTDGMSEPAAKSMVEILSSVVSNRSPRIRQGNAYWHAKKSYRRFEAFFAPLSPDDQTVNMIFAGHMFDRDA